MPARLTPHRHPIRKRRGAAITTALIAAAALAPATSIAATRVPCPKQPGEVARSQGAALWVRDGVLYGCAPAVRSKVAAYRATQRTKIKLGTWTEGSVASLSKIDAVWTERTVSDDGSVADRIWAFDLRRGKAWLRGITALPAASDDGAEVVAVRAASDIAAWVTSSGTVVLRARESEDELVDLGIGGLLVGDKDPGVAGAGLVPEAQLVETKRRVVVGSWPEQVDALARTLKFQIDEFVGSDETECSVTLVWKLTVRPVDGGPRVGATWAANNDELPSDCSRPTLPR